MTRDIPDFDAATQVSTTGDGIYESYLTHDWSIGPVPNGGYSTAAAIRALLDFTERETQLSTTAYYYRPTIANRETTIRCALHRAGRISTSASAELFQDGKLRTRVSGLFGELDNGAAQLAAPAPSIAAPPECTLRDPASQGLNMTLMQSLEIRLEDGHPTVLENRAIVDGWVRFRDDRHPDHLGLSLFLDSFPPAVLAVRPEAGWIPTLELTSQIRNHAAPGWIQVRVESLDIGPKRLIEDVRLWDSAGTLVAQGRQLAMVLD